MSTIMKQSSRHRGVNIGIWDLQDENQIKDLPICFATLHGFLSASIQKYFVDWNYWILSLFLSWTSFCAQSTDFLFCCSITVDAFLPILQFSQLEVFSNYGSIWPSNFVWTCLLFHIWFEEHAFNQETQKTDVWRSSHDFKSLLTWSWWIFCLTFSLLKIFWQCCPTSKPTIVLKETKQTPSEANRYLTRMKMEILEHLSPIFQYMTSAFVSVSHHTMLVCCHTCLLLLFGWSESLHCCGAEEIEKDASDPVLQVFQ